MAFVVSTRFLVSSLPSTLTSYEDPKIKMSLTIAFTPSNPPRFSSVIL